MADLPGVPTLPAVQARLGELFSVAPERVIVTVGASGAMLMAALRYFRPGSTVVAEVPSYQPLRRLPTYLGAETKLIRRRMEISFPTKLL